MWRALWALKLNSGNLLIKSSLERIEWLISICWILGVFIFFNSFGRKRNGTWLDNTLCAIVIAHKVTWFANSAANASGVDGMIFDRRKRSREIQQAFSKYFIIIIIATITFDYRFIFIYTLLYFYYTEWSQIWKLNIKNWPFFFSINMFYKVIIQHDIFVFFLKK